jgi:hypothetical protein
LPASTAAAFLAGPRRPAAATPRRRERGLRLVLIVVVIVVLTGRREHAPEGLGRGRDEGVAELARILRGFLRHVRDVGGCFLGALARLGVGGERRRRRDQAGCDHRAGNRIVGELDRFLPGVAKHGGGPLAGCRSRRRDRLRSAAGRTAMLSPRHVPVRWYFCRARCCRSAAALPRAVLRFGFSAAADSVFLDRLPALREAPPRPLSPVPVFSPLPLPVVLPFAIR